MKKDLTDISEETKILVQKDVDRHLAKFINAFTESLEQCEDEFDYFGLHVALGVLKKTTDAMFEKNLLEDVANPEDISSWRDLLEDCVNSKYREQMRKAQD